MISPNWKISHEDGYQRQQVGEDLDQQNALQHGDAPFEAHAREGVGGHGGERQAEDGG
ncbi:MAG: hypothetical protein MZV65_36085 [Chromatiales bacterium]|nr:hypothetical protein [Chromatiales bacterium]